MTEKLPRVTASDAIRHWNEQDFSYQDRVEVARYTKIKKARE